jgi:methyl-accepting chemotaxis protein
MNKVSLKMKLGVGFGALLAILITMGGISYRSTQKLGELSEQADQRANAMFLATKIGSIMNDQKAEYREFLLSDTEAEMSRYAENNSALTQTFSKLEPLMTSDEDRRQLAELRQASDSYHSIIDHVVELHRAGKKKEATDLIHDPKSDAVRADLKKIVDDFAERQNEHKTKARAEQAATEASTERLMLILALVGLAVGVVVAILIARSIVAAVSRMVAMLQEIAANNLAIEDMEITSQDEIGKAGAALNSMKNNLREIMQSIAGTAEHVASASEEISAGATQTASGSETQKDQVHQIATAMQEMSATVREVSDNSNKAADSSRQATETARGGGAIVEDTLSLMRSIAGSVRETAKSVQELGNRSDQIGKIVGVIDDIADQTNLLALNAAIEAARAGEQGRGFAVVADEVRKLAERTTKATKEIAEMIQSVQTETRGAVDKMQSGTQQVEKGVEVTAKAGDALKQIIGQTEHVGEMVTHIATAATEQSSATEQVNANMEQINKLVAESAEGAQQSAKACEQLSSLAFELQNLVSRFKLGQQTHVSIAAASAVYRPSRQAAADPVRVRTALALPAKPPVQRVLQHAGYDRDGE